jgi:DegV family protein with EDD domain
MTVARELKGEFKIIPFNSLGGSAAIGFMCREARELSRTGASLDAIVKRLEYVRENMTVTLTLDTLDFTRMSGRVGALAAALASVPKMKPVIELQEGMLVITDKVRSCSRSIERILDKAHERVEGRLVNAAVMHVRARDVAEELRRRVQTTLHSKELFLEQISNTITAQLGPGAVGIVAYPVEQP